MKKNMSIDTLTRADGREQVIEAPAPTAWPIILAFGLTLVFTGLVTSWSVSFLGAILALSGSIGWFRDVLPHEKQESLPIMEKAQTVTTSRPQVARVRWILPQQNDCANRGLPLGRFDHFHDSPLDLFCTRWSSLWRRASDVSSPPDSAWGRDWPGPVVWLDPQHPRRAGSGSQPADRLGLVCDFADRIRRRRRHHSFQARASAHLAIPSPRYARRD